MRKNEVTEGGVYLAKVNGQTTRVRIDKVRETKTYRRSRTGYSGQGEVAEKTIYDVTNLKTGRKVVFRSAQKFHPLPAPKPVEEPVAVVSPEAVSPVETVVETVPPVVEESSEVAGTKRSALKSLRINHAVEPVAEPCPPSSLPVIPELHASVGPTDDEKPTAEQAEILRAVQSGHRVLIIEAGAGTGKTTSLRMIGKALQGNGQYTAFNTALVAESKDKFRGTKVSCNTTHSLGFRAVGKQYAHRIGKGRVRSEQVAMMLGIEPLNLHVDDGTPDGQTRTLSAGYLASQVSGAVKRFCQSADAEVTERHFRYIDGIDSPADGQRTYDNNERVWEYLLPFAKKAWADLSVPSGQLPFSHDHYVKVWQLNKPVIAADYILVDESQDLSPVMLSILQHQIEAGIPVIMVGDSAQQIYEWRGAVNAMAHFPEAPRCFLSQSFRFGPAIAAVANAVLETLDDPTPLRLKGLETLDSKVCETKSPTAILCRTNAVAVAALLGAIGEGKHPFLVGGGSDVIAFVEAAEALQGGRSTGHPDLACFSTWSEVQRYSKEDDGEDLRLLVRLIDEFGCRTIIDALKGMREEKDADLVISTAHKSKGRAWKSVQLAQDFPTKSKCSDADRKLLYVAVTRARLELDISRCPFFTGNDSLDVSRLIKADQSNATSILPSTPVARPLATEFTWAKRDGKWCARGPAGMAGKTVDVVRKDGSRQAKRLVSIVAEFPEATIYNV